MDFTNYIPIFDSFKNKLKEDIKKIKNINNETYETHSSILIKLINEVDDEEYNHILRMRLHLLLVKTKKHLQILENINTNYCCDEYTCNKDDVINKIEKLSKVAFMLNFYVKTHVIYLNSIINKLK